MKIQDLSNTEKVILAQELWDSVVIDQKTLDVTQEQIKELNQRLAKFEMDGEVGSSWSEVKERVLKS
ncbi:MAG: addiction module protein [Cellvibrionaceae bacterium]|nr:addiction module protein [Cellvibrionaceae bacterium]